MEKLFTNSFAYRLLYLFIIIYLNSKTKKCVDNLSLFYSKSVIASLINSIIYKRPAIKGSLYQTIINVFSAKISIISARLHTFLNGVVSGSVLCKKFITGSIILRYETSLYILCLYVFLDYFIRTYIGGFKASLWDKLYFVLLLCVWAYKWIKNKQDKIITTPLDGPLMLFYGVALIVFVGNSINFAQSFEGLRAAVQNTLWFLVVTQIISSKENGRNIFRVLILVTLLVSLHGIYQYIIGVEMPPNWVDSLETGIKTRVFSIIGSPNILASLITLIGPLALAFFFAEKNYLVKLIYMGAFGAMSLCLVFTFSRGAWIGYLVAVGLYVFIKDKRLIAPAILSALLIAVLVPSVSSRLMYMLSPEYIQSSLRAGRLVRWIEGIDIVRVRPFMGMGHGSFGGAVAVNNEVAGVFYMDNYFLKTAVEMGLLGFTAFVVLMGSVMLWTLRTALRLTDNYYKELSIGAFAGLTGVIIHNVVENVFEVPMMVTYFWVIAAVVMYFFRTIKLKERTG